MDSSSLHRSKARSDIESRNEKRVSKMLQKHQTPHMHHQRFLLWLMGLVGASPRGSHKVTKENPTASGLALLGRIQR